MQFITEVKERLNAIAEPSNRESKTASLVNHYIAQSSPDYHYRSIGGEGILAGYQGERGEGASIMFRSELDGVEIGGRVAHLCGHDGHMTILIGLSRVLSKNREFSGVVWLLFQPAEEVGEGAKRVVEELHNRGIKFDYSFALHNKPGLPLGEVVLYKTLYAAASLGLELHFKGREAHASNPELALSPLKAIVETVDYMDSLLKKGELFNSFVLGTVVNISLGEANYGVAPGEGYLRITLRAFQERDLKTLLTHLEQFALKRASQEGIALESNIFDRFPVTLNSDRANEIVERVLVERGVEWHYAQSPELGSEDFGHFSQNSLSCYFDIGNGLESRALHQEGYQFSNEIIELAIDLYSSIIYSKRTFGRY